MREMSHPAVGWRGLCSVHVMVSSKVLLGPDVCLHNGQEAIEQFAHAGLTCALHARVGAELSLLHLFQVCC